jgi:hypothetical protein
LTLSARRKMFRSRQNEEGATEGAKPQRLTGSSSTGIIRFKHRLLHYRRARRTAITKATTTHPTTDIFCQKNARSRFGGEKWKPSRRIINLMTIIKTETRRQLNAVTSVATLSLPTADCCPGRGATHRGSSAGTEECAPRT